MRICLFISVAWLCLSGCVSTKQVYSFTAKSMTALEKFEDLKISQQKVNKDEYDLSLIRKTSILSNKNYKQGWVETANYKRASEADSITVFIYNVCINYFEALNNLSAKEVGTVKLDDAISTLQKGNYGGIEITEAQASAYTNLGNQLGRAVLGSFRQKKLKEYIREGNAPLQTMLSKLNEIVAENDSLNLEKERENLMGLYFDLSKDENATEFEKKNITQEYYASLRKLSITEKQLQLYSKAIKTVAEGHQTLYDNMDNLKKSETQQALAEYGSLLSGLVAAFKKLNN